MGKRQRSINKLKRLSVVIFTFVSTILSFVTSRAIIFTDVNNPYGYFNKVDSVIQYNQLIAYIDRNSIKRVDFYDNTEIAITELKNSDSENNKVEKKLTKIPQNVATDLVVKLKRIDVDINANPPKKDSAEIFIFAFTCFAILFALFISRATSRKGITPKTTKDEEKPSSSSQQSQQISSIRRLNAEFIENRDTGVTFDDVAGIDEVKAEFENLVKFLDNPSRFTRVGAKFPKGILLVGPPGTGKTLLARALATEAKVPFLNTAGPEFMEMFVGVGASRVRDLFNRAKKKTPCIIFIDEIDSIGRKRGGGVGPGNEEREQTLNQLLTEMDGFEKNYGIIVVAATNRDDLLDDALVRPGRFSKKIRVGLPDSDGRREILEIYAKNKKFAEDVDLAKIAERAAGFTGADLANLLNEAAISTRRNKTNGIIRLSEINESFERIIGGIAGKPIKNGRFKRLIAYRESGRALVSTLLVDHDPVQTITLVPRGRLRGSTWFRAVPEELSTRKEILARIIGMLAGRATEQIFFGSSELTTSNSIDFRQATDLARKMVVEYGMSGLSPMALVNNEGRFVFVGRGIRVANEFSQYFGMKIDRQIQSIMRLCYTEALETVNLNKVSIQKAVSTILKTEYLTGEQFEEIVSKYSRLPVNKNYIAIFPERQKKLIEEQKKLNDIYANEWNNTL
uniref:cell division protein n=1 Tax=Haramonas pauciplastida TaxID=478668 RepID=UPI00211529C0|nr:cell division protein [Haramonas pauciplastida]UTE94924.1 cell division protein [Haramonas pauciplastida]